MVGGGPLFLLPPPLRLIRGKSVLAFLWLLFPLRPNSAGDQLAMRSFPSSLFFFFSPFLVCRGRRIHQHLGRLTEERNFPSPSFIYVVPPSLFPPLLRHPSFVQRRRDTVPPSLFFLTNMALAELVSCYLLPFFLLFSLPPLCGDVVGV